MRLAFLLKSFIWPSRLPIKSSAPSLSLTSQDGVWIRSIDFVDRRHLLLLFVHDVEQPKNLEWIRQFDGLYPQNTSVFVISKRSTKALRELREREELNIDFLFDPLSIEARRFGMSGRRFQSKTGAVLITPEQKIAFCRLGHPSPDDILQHLEISKEEQNSTHQIDTKGALQLMEKGHILVDVRTFSEYEAHHSPQALHIPIEELSARMGELPQKDRIIFICQAGERALAASELLRALGAKKVSVVSGGMTKWNGPQRHGVSN